MLSNDVVSKSALAVASLALCLNVACVEVVSSSEVQSMFDALSEARKTLRSFQGEYVFEARDLDIDTKPLILHAKEMFDSQNKRLRTERVVQSGVQIEIFARIEGETYAFNPGVKSAGESTNPTLLRGYDWPYDVDSTLTIANLSGSFGGETFGSRLSRGKRVGHRNGEITILTHIDEFDGFVKRVDFYVDKDMNIVRVLEGYAPTTQESEVYVLLGRDPLGLFEVHREYVFGDFAPLNGRLDIPLQATKVVSRPRAEARKKKKSLRDAGAISQLEYLEWYYSSESREPIVEQRLTLDMSSVQVNPELSRSDFEIEVPVGTIVNDKKSGHKFKVGVSSEEMIGGLLDVVNRTGSDGPEPRAFRTELNGSQLRGEEPPEESGRFSLAIVIGTVGMACLIVLLGTVFRWRMAR